MPYGRGGIRLFERRIAISKSSVDNTDRVSTLFIRINEHKYSTK